MNLKAGDKLKLSWEARNNEMVVVVRNTNVTSTNVNGKKQELEFKEKRKLKRWQLEHFLVPIVTSHSVYTFQKMHKRQHTKCEDKDTTYHNLELTIQCQNCGHRNMIYFCIHTHPLVVMGS